MCTFNRVLAVLTLVVITGVLSQRAGALLADHYVATRCEVVSAACQ